VWAKKLTNEGVDEELHTSTYSRESPRNSEILKGQ
jgi:hypothetical protein